MLLISTAVKTSRVGQGSLLLPPFFSSPNSHHHMTLLASINNTISVPTLYILNAYHGPIWHKGLDGGVCEFLLSSYSLRTTITRSIQVKK